MAEFKETSMAAIFQNQVQKYGTRACAAHKVSGKFVDISWNTMNEYIRNTAFFLLSLGVKKNDKVAIFSHTCHQWWIADQAIASIGAISVPIYPTDTAKETRYILKNSDSKACFVDNDENIEKLGKLSSIIAFTTEQKKTGMLTLDQAIEKGSKYKNKDEFEKRLNSIKIDDVATIIYTSGTTGDPKGVMLTHNNLISQSEQILEGYGHVMSDNDKLVSFLPLSHAIERMGGYYMVIRLGAKTFFAENLEEIAADLLTVRPTILISVPRIYEKLHAGILAKVKRSSFIKRAIFNRAMKKAAKNVPYACAGKERKGLFKISYNIADKLIFSKMKEALGFDRLQFALAGGGPLTVADAEFFIGMGFIIVEGFGLTETSPVTHCNRIGQITPGSVGTPLKGTEARIAEDGEVQVKGPQVMKGYYKNTKATKEAFTKDGFFKTGDLGTIDGQDRLYITGRIKDIIITSGGKNISPQNIENNLKRSPYIEQIALIGDRRKYISALIIPAFELLREWANSNGIQYFLDSELVDHEKVHKLFEDEIEKYSQDFMRVSRVKKFKILNAKWCQESGELTPTMKVKRRIIEDKYAEEIESLYPEE
ncbi:MAG: long-chain fatty acid--CoA ligase [bacterium]|nr:long-chain fatty acid--CoA ligase [bacterium]